MFSKLCFFDASVRGSRRRPAIAAPRVTACRFGTAYTPVAARTEPSAATAAAHALKRPASKTQSGTGARSLRAEGVVLNAARCTLMPLLIPAFAAAIRFRIPAAAILRFTSRKRVVGCTLASDVRRSFACVYAWVQACCVHLLAKAGAVVEPGFL